MAVSVQQAALELEASLYGLVEKQGDPTLDEHISQATGCLKRLTAAHDASLAAVVRPTVDLEASLEQFQHSSMALKEKKGEKRAIATLMASDEIPNSTLLLDDLTTLAELPDSIIQTSHEDTASFVVHNMVEEFKSRQNLYESLQALQSERDDIQRNVTRKLESSVKLASMVHDINTKASEALLNFTVEQTKLPHKQAASNPDLPGPLHVLFSQFSSIKAIYEDKLQVEVKDSSPEVPGDQVQVTVPGPEERPSCACTVCFGFSEEMNTVLAYSSTHPELLSQFDPSDTGSNWPHQVTPVHCTGCEQPDIPVTSKPFRSLLCQDCRQQAHREYYVLANLSVRASPVRSVAIKDMCRWCQKLAGLELLAPPHKATTEAPDAVSGRTTEGFVWRIQQLLMHT